MLLQYFVFVWIDKSSFDWRKEVFKNFESIYLKIGSVKEGSLKLFRRKWMVSSNLVQNNLFLLKMIILIYL